MADSELRSSRDTRLLVLVILTALAVLFFLATFRVPEATVRPAAPPTGLLDRIAPRGAYEDLATAVYSTLQRAAPGIVQLEITATVDPAKTGRPRPSAAAAPPNRLVPAVRISPELALATIPAGFDVVPGGPLEIGVRAADTGREMVIAYARPRDAGDRPPAPATDFPGYKYVAVVEAAAGGPTASPVFIGRVDFQVDERWGGDLLIPGGSAMLPVGALIYTLDSRFVGMVIGWPDGSRRIVPAEVLTRTMGGGGAGGER
jgi:hypothetical protein